MQAESPRLQQKTPRPTAEDYDAKLEGDRGPYSLPSYVSRSILGQSLYLFFIWLFCQRLEVKINRENYKGGSKAGGQKERGNANCESFVRDFLLVSMDPSKY